MQPCLVTAESVTSQIKRNLRTLLPDELDALEALVDSGWLIGNDRSRCYFSALLRASGQKPLDSQSAQDWTKDLLKLVRARFGVRLDPDNLSPTELFFHGVREGQTPFTNTSLAHLVTLVSEIRQEIRLVPAPTTAEAQEDNDGPVELYV